ncbi:MAG: hypothetical protein ACRCT8_05705 [Lacipirellulaceae bacterium]
MLLYLLVVATLNLCVGFGLGATIGMPPIPELRIPRMRRAKPAAEGPSEVSLTAPAAAQPSKPAVTKAVPAAAGPAVATTANPSPAAAAAPTASGPAAEASPAAAPRKSPRAEALAGLAAMREKLADVSLELRESSDRPESFDACATKLQAVNHEYLEQAQAAIEKLDELSATGDVRSAEARDVVTSGVSEVAVLSGEVDKVLDAGLDDAARAKLLGSAKAIQESAARVSEATASGVTVASIDLLFDQLEMLIEAAAADRPTILAAIDLDPVLGHESDAALTAAICLEVESLLAESRASTQTFGRAGRYLMLLNDEDLGPATERVELLRQRVAATTFRSGDTDLSATVTCTLAEVTGVADRAAIEAQLAQVATEAQRLGGNRTYHHDGAFPAPVPTAALKVEPRCVVV